MGPLMLLLAERTLLIPRLSTTTMTKKYSSISEKTYFYSHKFDLVDNDSSLKGGKESKVLKHTFT